MKDLILKNISYGYGIKDVLSSVELVARQSEVTTILGESGSGKSTLLKIIAGLIKPKGGEIVFGGQVLFNQTTFVQCEKRKFGYVPQDGALFFNLNVIDNVTFGLTRKQKKQHNVVELLEKVGLVEFRKRMPSQLSGGQRQRVALARALAIQPEIILLDEPFSSLDTNLRNEVRFEVKNILSQFDTAAILVTHDQDEALSISDSIAILKNGKFISQGRPREIYSNPTSLDVARYFGNVNIIQGVATDNGVKTNLGVLRINSTENRAEIFKTPGNELKVLIRPEQIMIKSDPGGTNRYRATSVEYFGHDSLVELKSLSCDNEHDSLIMRNSTTYPIQTNQIVEIEIVGPVSVF